MVMVPEVSVVDVVWLETRAQSNNPKVIRSSSYMLNPKL